MVIDGFGLSATDIAFVKLILAKSPVLKNVSISYNQSDCNQALATSEIFKSLPQESSDTEITVLKKDRRLVLEMVVVSL